MRSILKRIFRGCPAAPIAAIIDPETKRATARAIGDLRRAKKSNEKAVMDILTTLAECPDNHVARQ